MKISEYAKYDGIGLAELVKARQVTPRELAEAALAAIDKLNGEINAVIAKVPEETERSLKEGPGKGAFEGVPYLIKDAGMHYANVPSEFGSRLFEDFTLHHDSELAVRFKQAGVVAVGRSNVPEFGINATTEPIKNGPTRNPWDTTRIVGGSSGGSAAAVAAGMVPVAHANDGGGSIRIPSSCCGVFGLKPSRFRQPCGPDMDEAIFGLGSELVVSRSVRDSAAMLDATAGTDIGARYQLPEPSMSFLAASQCDPRRLRIAFSLNPPEGAPELHPECKEAVLNTATLCEELGHDVFEASPDVTHDESCAIARDITAPFLAMAVEMIPPHLGRQVGPDTLEATSRAILDHGRSMTAVGLAQALGVANIVSRKLGRFFTTCDVWLTPVLTSPPLKLGAFNANEEGVDAHQWIKRLMDFAAFCPMFNASGQPAMSVPLHWTKDGMPVGVQFVTHFADEMTLFALAGQLERARPWVDCLPPVSAASLS